MFSLHCLKMLALNSSQHLPTQQLVPSVPTLVTLYRPTKEDPVIKIQTNEDAIWGIPWVNGNSGPFLQQMCNSRDILL